MSETLGGVSESEPSRNGTMKDAIEKKLVAVSRTLEIPLNKHTEALLDAIYKFMVDVSSVHALHASAVSEELRTRFTDMPIPCWQLRNFRS